MNSIKLFFLLSTTLMAFVGTPAASPLFRGKPETDLAVTANNLFPEAELDKPPTSLRGPNSFRYYKASRPLALTKCGTNPTACAAKGSAGPSCCGNKCVNLQTDKMNCGKCGTKCGFSQVCCGGVCVNPMASRSHCGSCNKRCQKGGRCSYGMCSYA